MMRKEQEEVSLKHNTFSLITYKTFDIVRDQQNESQTQFLWRNMHKEKIFLLSLIKYFIYAYVHILVCFYVHHVYVDAGESDNRAWKILELKFKETQELCGC